MQLIYLSPVPWNSFSQRPHELIRYFHSRTGGKVLWIDPYHTRLPTMSDLLGRRPASPGRGDYIPDWLTLIKPKALPLEPLPFSGMVNGLMWSDAMSQALDFTDSATILGIGKPSELALQLLSKGTFASSFYDAMDDFPAFYSGWSSVAMARRESETVREVSTVLTSSSALRDRLKPSARDVRLVLNACASTRLPPVTTRHRSDGSRATVIGYVGTIAKWFDWDLLLALAAAHPQAKFRLVGPMYGRAPASLPENVFLEPPVPHAAALRTMTEFDVGLIPFKSTPLTSSVDPIKYYEYRGLGIPIVSSVFGEMALREQADGVYLINQDTDMVKVIDQALDSNMNMEKLTQFREENSWESRFDQANIFAS